jgi:hypothetical protein
MGTRDNIEALQQHLESLAACSDDELARYGLLRPSKPPGLYWQLRWLAGRAMRWLESKGLKQPDRWPVGLKHHGSARAKPVLIWAVGADREMLRTACNRFAELQTRLPDFAPVLVTDVADFAFFSRLGWLVEYLPALTGEGQPYEVRKAQFIARLYRGAPALPVTAVLENRSRDDVLRWLGPPGAA